MSKILIKNIAGAQEVIDVEDGGAYFDLSSVLWDEREDGPLPEITLGGMSRDGNSLVFDQPTFDAHCAVMKSSEDAVFNASIIQQLSAIDAKSIRALREGNQERIDALESEAAALRLQLRKD